MSTRIWVGTAIMAVAGLVFLPAAASAEHADCCDRTICSEQGFEISLVSFHVDPLAGTSTWDYRVCNDQLLSGACVPPKDLSHVNIDLPGLGQCLTPNQSIQLAQTGGFAQATLACGVSSKDPSCDDIGTPGTDFVAKCDVAGGDLDPGECVTMRLTIAGEMPTLGSGNASTTTKAGRNCASDCILGPACHRCGVAPPEDQCLTRTAGFWGNHPHISNLFLPVTVCGKPLNKVEAGSCDSATEALCVAPGRESRSNPAYAQLVRQLTAAKLNLEATSANGGRCGDAVADRIVECEALCGNDQETISTSGCIEDLAAFNESLDTFPFTPPPFDSPGPANPRHCQRANGNGIVIGKGTCS